MNNEVLCPELTFNEDKHIYRLNGVQIPSVSRIMKPLSAYLYRTVDEETLNRAAVRGTAVHNAIENFTLYGIEDIPAEYAGYFEAYQRFIEDVKPEILWSEQKIYNKALRYAGTADMCAVIGGRKVLIDFKTSAAVNRMLTGVQLEPYAMAFNTHDIQFDEKAILHLKRNGFYQVIRYDKNDIESKECFDALLIVYHHMQRFK